MHSHTVDDLSDRARGITTVQIIDLDCDVDDTALPLADVVKQLSDALANIPEQFRASAMFRIKAYGDYASASFYDT